MSEKGAATADCLFCRIIAGEIPAEIVAANEFAIAIRDIAPVGPVHLLIVPRAHVKDASELDASHGQLVIEMIALAQQVARSEAVEDSGYRLVFNVGDDAGNTVPHLHLHVIGGRQLVWPPG